MRGLPWREPSAAKVSLPVSQDIGIAHRRLLESSKAATAADAWPIPAAAPCQAPPRAGVRETQFDQQRETQETTLIRKPHDETFLLPPALDGVPGFPGTLAEDHAAKNFKADLRRQDVLKSNVPKYFTIARAAAAAAKAVGLPVRRFKPRRASFVSSLHADCARAGRRLTPGGKDP